MSCFETGTVVELAPGEIITFRDIQGTTLRVTRGTLWVTQDGCREDVVLRAGDNWVVERAGDTVIDADRGALFCVVARRGVAGRRLTLPGPMRRGTRGFFSSWLARVAAKSRHASPAVPHA